MRDQVEEVCARSEEGRDGRPGAGEDPVKRRQIIDGARRAFVALGFDAASMNDVVRAAGVSKSTLYVYFRSKEELFAALIADERSRYFADIEATLSDPTRPAEALRRFGLKLAAFSTSPAAVLAKRTVIAVATRMPELGRDFYRDGPARGQATAAAFLEDAVAAGSLAIDDVPLAAAQFIELATTGFVRRQLFDDEAPVPSLAELERIVDSAVSLFMAGYGAPGYGIAPL